MKKLIALLLALVMVLSLAACGGNETPASEAPAAEAPEATEAPAAPEAPAEPVEVTIWHLFGESLENGAPHAYYVEWAERFNASQDEIHVSVLGGKSATDIQTAIAAGETPDIFMNYWNNAAQWANAGALLDLTPYYESDTEWNYNDIMPGALALSQYDGKFYSVPNSYSTTFMFYNADILSAAGWDTFPTTTDELMQCIKDTTEANADGSIKTLGLLPNMPWLDTEMWAAAFNANWISEDGKTATATGDANKAMFQFILDIYKFYEDEFGWDALAINDFGDTVRGNRATANDPVLTGEVAMRWNSENLAATLAVHGKDVNWKMAWFPNVAGGEARALLTSNVWQINAKSANPDAAWKALADLTSSENQKIMAVGENNNGYFYARRSVLEYINEVLADQLGAAKEDPATGAKVTENLKVISDAMLNGNLKAFPNFAYVNEYLNAISNYGGLIFTGDMTVDEALEAVQEEVQPLLDDSPYVPYVG